MPRWHTSSLPSTLILVATLSGCGGDASDADAQAQLAIDPRRETASALVEYINELTTRGSVNYAALIELFFAENDLQRRILELERRSLPIYDMALEVRLHFDEFWSRGSETFDTRPHEEAQLVSQTPDRAEALQREPGGYEARIYLVRIQDQWWISGFTIEYDQRIRDFDESVKTGEFVAEAVLSFAPEMTQRLRADEFETYDQYLAAVGEYLKQWSEDRGTFSDP